MNYRITTGTFLCICSHGPECLRILDPFGYIARHALYIVFNAFVGVFIDFIQIVNKLGNEHTVAPNFLNRFVVVFKSEHYLYRVAFRDYAIKALVGFVFL